MIARISRNGPSEMKILGIAVLLVSLASLVCAVPAPEIDGGYAVNAIGLIAGVVLIVRSRGRK